VSRFSLLLFMLPTLLFAASSNDRLAATYRTSASEVRVTFFTTDQNNRPVSTIGTDDFAIVDGDIVVREFRSLSRSDETMLDVFVLVDTSESVGPRFPATRNELLQLVFARESAPNGISDNISVVSFSGLQATLLCAHNCSQDAARQNLLALKPAGATPLYDALAYAANLISQGQAPGVRTVLILFSGGDDTISKISAQDACRPSSQAAP
jgi:Mg-chelatase subunit ChlD